MFCLVRQNRLNFDNASTIFFRQPENNARSVILKYIRQAVRLDITLNCSLLIAHCQCSRLKNRGF
ncbi:MAG: hypothetical protein IIU35_00635, partial [Neisseriaceae bacterium]|nr:hypothetical protein [Neisseriaceae bacterium]